MIGQNFTQKPRGGSAAPTIEQLIDSIFRSFDAARVRMTSVTPATHPSVESHFYADRGRHASPTACAGSRMVRLDELTPRRPFCRYALECVDGEAERAAVLAEAAERGLALLELEISAPVPPKTA